MARVATRVQALEGIERIEVTEEGILVDYNPEQVKPETIVTSFELQGLAVKP